LNSYGAYGDLINCGDIIFFIFGSTSAQNVCVRLTGSNIQVLP
jgi:hypothetical protein